MRALRRFAEAVAAGLLAVIFIAFILQIALRYVFDWPVGWTAEISLVAWLWLVLWGAAFVLKDEEEIRIDVLEQAFGPRVRRVARAIGSIAIVVLFGMALPATWDYVSFMKVESTSYLKIRFDWLFSIYLAFAVAVIVRHLWQIVELVRAPRMQPVDPPPPEAFVNFTSPFSLALATIVALSLLGVPVGQAMIGGSILYLWLKGMDMGSAAEQLLNSTYSSYLLLAIPLFILAASFMSTGSVLDRLLRFCNAIVGRFPGGLAQVNVLQSIVFASMSGSALDDAAGSGKLMQAMMTRNGKYTPAFAGALTAVSAVIGPILPPSIPLVLYALISGTSIGFLFLAGVLPGLLLAAVQMALIYVQARRHRFPVEPAVPLRDLPRITREALPALMLPIILLGCLYSGITTPTEAAGLAAAYALLVASVLYRSLGWRDVGESLLSSARTSISIGMLIAGALVFNYVITSENIPASLSAVLRTLDMSPLAFLLAVNLLLLVLGAFLEGSTIILVILPVLLPTAVALGVDPVHFGVVAVLNIMIGLITPPYGLLLFMMTKIANVSLLALVREVMPFLVVMIGALVVITLWPDFVLFLPRLAGYTG